MIDYVRMPTPYHLIPALLLATPLPWPLHQLRVGQWVWALLNHRLLARPLVLEPRVLAEMLLLGGLFELYGELVEGDDVSVCG